MSGHSKWATIHRQKEVKDAKRGQLFTKLARSITVAVQEGGGTTDPSSNFKLRLAMEKARAINMPKENVDRAIKRGTGEGGEDILKTVTYEGYGPSGVAMMIETSTDNTNRTSQEIKNILENGGGSLAGPGSVTFQFESVGVVTIAKPDGTQEAILKLIDLGATEVEEVGDEIEVYVKPSDLEVVKEKIEKEGFKVQRYELDMHPKNEIVIGDQATAQKILSLMEHLEEQADVIRVFANFNIPDEILAKQEVEGE